MDNYYLCKILVILFIYIIKSSRDCILFLKQCHNSYDILIENPNSQKHSYISYVEFKKISYLSL